MHKGRSVRRTIRRIRKLCKSVEMYVVRISGLKSNIMRPSKPCVRCSSQLKLLGFRKIYYIDEINHKCERLSMKDDMSGKLSWGLKNLRK